MENSWRRKEEQLGDVKTVSGADMNGTKYMICACNGVYRGF
jgi:hypothetical protein